MNKYNINFFYMHLFVLVQDKNTSLKLPVGVSPLQLLNLHRNRRYFVIKLHTWFCLSYFLKTNIKFYCIYQYFMSINSFFNTVSVSRYSRPITVTRDPLYGPICNAQNIIWTKTTRTSIRIQLDALLGHF
jgi:hypothetical protein